MDNGTAPGSFTQAGSEFAEKCTYCRTEDVAPGESAQLMRLCEKCLDGVPFIFFDNDGVLAEQLASCIEGMGPLASSSDGRFWQWIGGTWIPEPPDQSIVEKRSVVFLRNKFRAAHAKAAAGIIRATAPRISCDPVPEYVNFKNGLLDWKRGVLEEHRPSMMSTVQMGCEWIPEAPCPKFDRFLEQVVPPDCIDLMWDLIGYLMFSGNDFHTAVMLVGEGRNGKGTFLRLVQRIIGHENTCSVSLRQLAEGSDRFATADLYGRSCNIAGDIDGSYIKDTAMFKSVTGGDRITGQFKFKNAFTFEPWAVPIFSANKIPASADATVGYLARWLVIPFPHSFVGTENRKLDSELAAEMPGVAAKAMRALPALLERGRWDLPAAAREAKERFAQDVDHIRRWIAQEFTPDAAGFVTRSHMWSVYETWVAAEHVHPVGASSLYKRIESLGYTAGASNGQRGFRGLRMGGSGWQSTSTVASSSDGTVVTMSRKHMFGMLPAGTVQLSRRCSSGGMELHRRFAWSEA